MLRKVCFLLLLLAGTQAMLAQIGGTRAYRFLDLPMTARAAALGGTSMSIWGDDINLVYSNPSLLNAQMHGQLALNYCNHVGDLNFGYLGYGHHFGKHGTVAGGIQFFDYGRFQGYDEFGQSTASFRASDYSINLTYAKPFEDSSFQVGIALKTIISQYDIYRSYGNAIDFGITWHNQNNLVISVLVRNIGFIWKGYSNVLSRNEPLPQNVQFGASYKLDKAPFRVFVVYDQFLSRNLKYISPVDTTGKTNPFNTATQQDSTRWQKFSERFGNRSDNFMRHIIVGTEIVLTKNFHIRIAYNYRRQREMILPERRGMNGLSLGFGFRIRRFGFNYSFAKMAFPGNSSIFNVNYTL